MGFQLIISFQRVYMQHRMEELQRPRPQSNSNGTASSRRPGTSPLSRKSGEIPMQILNDRPASAQATAGLSMSESELTVSHTERDQGNTREQYGASSDALAAQSSIFSLPVLKSEAVSRVTLLEDGEEDLSLSQVVINTPVHMKPLGDEPQDYPVDRDRIQCLVHLTEGETEFDSDKEIPDIFQQVDQVEKYSLIKDLKEQLEGDEVKPYVHAFSDDMKEESLLVGKMSREQIEEEEKQLQLEHLAYQEQEAAKQLDRQKQVMVSKEVAKREMSQTMRRRKRDLKQKEAQVVQFSMIHHKELYSAFNTAQKQMIRALNFRKAEVKTLYGDLQRADGYYGGIKGRRWKVDWNKAPQPVQIKLKSLRGVRGKLPGSRYVLLVSLFDRLGGHVLRWSKLKGQQWAASTVPVDHQGHYYSTEIKFDQNVYTVLPPRFNVRPSMVLVFELFVLRGAVSPTDRVVGWGVFPVCDAQFRIIEGKYKCPLLRGPVDPQITKHGQFEKLMTSDLENWLCNFYFEIVKLPRYLSGMHEYEVELQFSSALLGHPDRTHDERGVVDGNEPTHGTSTGNLLTEDTDTTELIGSPSPSSATAKDQSSSQALGGIIVPEFSSTSVSRGPLQSRLSRRLHTAPTDDLDCSSDEAEEVDGDRDRELAMDSGFTPVADQPGLYYKVHTFNPLEEKQGKSQVMYPHTPLLRERRRGQQQKKFLSEEEELQQHTVAVKKPFSDEIKKKRRITERVEYVGRQLVAEFGPSQWRSLEFWSLMVILILCWWVRLYLHYVIQYAFLRAIRIPVSRFEFFPHTVILNYQSSLLFTRETIAIVLLGPVFNTVIFCLLILLSWLVQLLFGGLPDLASQFILAFGVQALLDPYWIFIVDMALLRFQAPLPEMPTADVTKLYWHFTRLEGNGIIGVFLLIFLYLLVTSLTLACLYMFFLRVHKNGQLVDIYHRLKSPEELFFVPRDMEVSNQELEYVCRKAEQWRGAEGERRKVVVCDYVWMEEESGESLSPNTNPVRRVTTHISIHTLHLDGLRELYRHFLRLEDGSIIEVFGELSSVSGISPSLKNALTSQREDPSDQGTLEEPSPDPQPSTPHHQLLLSQRDDSDSAREASDSDSTSSTEESPAIAGGGDSTVQLETANDISGVAADTSIGLGDTMSPGQGASGVAQESESLHDQEPYESAHGSFNSDTHPSLNSSTVIEVEIPYGENDQDSEGTQGLLERKLSAGQLV